MAKGLPKNTRNLIRVALTGPESTGKSELSEQLAAHYRTVWVPEFARSYVAALQRPYTLEDIEHIARRQFELEEEAAAKASTFLFCDTEATVTKIWANHSFGTCPPWIQHNIDTHIYDLYLLCNTDLPWQYDPLREHPHLRDYFMERYISELRKRNVVFRIITGTGASRLEHAIKAINDII